MVRWLGAQKPKLCNGSVGRLGLTPRKYIHDLSGVVTFKRTFAFIIYKIKENI